MFTSTPGPGLGGSRTGGEINNQFFYSAPDSDLSTQGPGLELQLVGIGSVNAGLVVYIEFIDYTGLYYVMFTHNKLNVCMIPGFPLKITKCRAGSV